MEERMQFSLSKFKIQVLVEKYLLIVTKILLDIKFDLNLQLNCFFFVVF